MKIKYYCDSCGTEMKMNEKEWLKHLKKYHPKKVKNKFISFKGRVYYEN